MTDRLSMWRIYIARDMFARKRISMCNNVCLCMHGCIHAYLYGGQCACIDFTDKIVYVNTYAGFAFVSSRMTL